MATGAERSPRFIEAIRNVLVTYKGTVGSGVSLADVAKIARVEPITLVSSSLSSEKELYNILHGVLNIYTAYYLQAIGILSAELADVRILKILDKTNPDRDLKTLLASGYHALESHDTKELATNVSTFCLENAKYALPMLTEKKDEFAVESIFDENDDAYMATSIQKLETFDKLGSAVGKVVEVKFNTQGGSGRDAIKQEHAIAVSVKLDTMVIPDSVINSIMTSTKDTITLGSRFKDAIRGRISFIKDFLLCSDLINTQKKTMMNDTTGAYAALMKRMNNSKIYSALSGNISLAGISSIFVISEEDENRIQREIGGKLSNEHTRNIVFDNTSAMMLVVVDKEWERVSIYIRDSKSFSQNSYSSFKNSADVHNDTMLDMVKTMSLGQSPAF